MTELVPKRNVFEFNKKYFIQTSGTAIGTKPAPGYASLYLSIFERNMLNQHPIKPTIRLRYVDDIFMIWNDSEDKLKDLRAYNNTVNPAIQFTHAHSFKSVNLLDVLGTLTNDGTISTDLYTKPTDTHQYLHMNSCHPNHVKKAIAFLQATCILRICSDPATAQSRCNELIEYLVCRGHGRRRTQLEVQRAIDAHRNPQQHICNNDRAEYFTVQYHPGLPDIKGILKKFLPILYTSERMSMVSSRHPVVSFSQPKIFSQQLCRAKLQEPQKEAIQSKPYQGNRCQLCTAFVSANCVTSTSNSRTFHCRNQGTNCNTMWAVYVKMRDVCGMQYVCGMTNNIRSRMNGHKSDCQRFLNGDFSKSDTSSPYSHLKSHDAKIFKFQILEIL